MAASSTDYMTIGGAVVTIDGSPIGFTDNGIEVERTLELKEFEDGIPLLTQLRVPIREKVRVKIPMMEVLDPEKLELISLNIPCDTISGGAVSAIDSDNQEFTFGTHANPTMWQAFKIRSLTGLDVHTVTLTALKNVAEDTTYTYEDDYFLDSASGVVYRNPAGDITSGQTVRAVWSGTAVASKRLRLGNNDPLVDRELTLVHTSPVSGDVITIKLWKAYSDGKLNLSPLKEDFWKTEVEFLGTPDVAGHPSEPVGYFDFAAA